MGDFAPLFELLAEALPAFAVEQDEGPPLERFLDGAGFRVELAEYRLITETYSDMDTLFRGYLAIGPLRQPIRVIGEARVAELMRSAFASLVRPDGSVSLTDEYRLLLPHGELRYDQWQLAEQVRESGRRPSCSPQFTEPRRNLPRSPKTSWCSRSTTKAKTSNSPRHSTASSPRARR